MAAIFNRLAYAGLAIAAVGGIAKTALYNGSFFALLTRNFEIKYWKYLFIIAL